MRTQAKANAAAEARARMYIRRDLGWLEGFPGEENAWVVAPLGGEVALVVLDGELLHRSTRTINMLVREFPRVLPRLVGDVELWAQRRIALMDLTKRTVYDGEPLPLTPTDVHPLVPASQKRKVAGVRKALPELSSLIAVFEWSGWTAPEEMSSSLAWLRAHAQDLSVLSNRTQSSELMGLRLWQLSRDHGKRRVAPILSFLAQPSIWASPLECRRQHVLDHTAWVTKRKKSASCAPPARGEARLPIIVTEWVLWLATQDARTQRKGLEIFATLVEGCDAANWALWWKRFEKVIKLASRIPAQTKKRNDQHARTRLATIEQFKLLGDETPPAWPAKVLSDLLRNLPSQEQNGLWKTMVGGLEQWPVIHDGAAIRVAFSQHWLSIWQYSSLPDRAALVRLVAAFHSYARDASFAADALVPWSDIWGQLQGRRVAHIRVDHDILETLRSGEKLATFFQTLREVAATTSRQAQLLVQLCTTFPKGTVAEAYSALREAPVAEGYIPDDVLKFAASIASERATHLPRLLAALIEYQSRYDEIGSSLREIHGFASLSQRCQAFCNARQMPDLGARTQQAEARSLLVGAATSRDILAIGCGALRLQGAAL